MKWFKHDSDASEDPKIQKLIYKHGLEGYGLYFVTLELIARDMEDNLDRIGYLSDDWDFDFLANRFGFSPDKIRTMYSTMKTLGLFDSNSDVIYCPKIKNRCDEYTTKLIRFREKTSTKSGECQEHVGTKSDFVSQDKIRLDKIRIDKNIIGKKKYVKFLLSEEGLKAFYDKFPQYTEKSVRNEIEKADNWLKANGKRYKDYFAFGCNWIKNAEKYNNLEIAKKPAQEIKREVEERDPKKWRENRGSFLKDELFCEQNPELKAKIEAEIKMNDEEIMKYEDINIMTYIRAQHRLKELV